MLKASGLDVSDNDLEAGFFSRTDECTVLKPGPTALEGRFHDMSGQGLAQRCGRALVEQVLQSSCLEGASCSVIQYGASLLYRHAREPIQELVQ